MGPSLLIIAEDSLPEARGAVVTSFPLDYLLSPLGPVGADEPYSPPALYGKWELQLDHLTWALTISDTLAPPVRRPPTPKMVPGRCPPRLVPTLFEVPNNLLTSFRTVPIKCLIPLLFARSAINVVCYGSAMGINWCVCYQLYVSLSLEIRRTLGKEYVVVSCDTSLHLKYNTASKSQGFCVLSAM